MKRIISYLLVALIAFTAGVLVESALGRTSGYLIKAVDSPRVNLNIPVIPSLSLPRQEHGSVMLLDEKTGRIYCRSY